MQWGDVFFACSVMVMRDLLEADLAPAGKKSQEKKITFLSLFQYYSGKVIRDFQGLSLDESYALSI